MFDWNDYHTLALELGERTDPAAQRSAISRAYYAALHAARRYLVDVHHERVPKFEAHAFVWNWFTANQSGRSRIERKIGDNGKKLRTRREDADYETDFDPSKQLADSLARARTLLADIAELTSKRPK